MMYAIVIALGIIASLILIAYLKNSNLKKEKLAAIRQKWGQPVEGGRNLKLAAAYYNIIKQNNNLSAATATDLDLDTVFAFIDRTNSKCGQQYLYQRLYSNTSSINEVNKIDGELSALPTDRAMLEIYEYQ
jgi:uncharacterized protein (UPF0333 family)